MARLIIDDATHDRHLFPADFGRGLDLSRRPAGFAYGGTAEPFPESLVVPRPEWQARIEERKARKATLRGICDQAKLPPKNQQDTNYCWWNSPTYCVEVLRVRQGQAPVELSAASGAAQATNYANPHGRPARGVGGFGKDALDWIASKGVTPVKLWPVNAIDPRYATPEAAQAALDYRVTEWWELEPGNLDHVVSALLLGLPVSAGLSWWGHQVSYIDPDWIDGAIAIDFRNSWGRQYGDDGYGTLQGRRMLPDDATCPRVAVAA